MLFVTKECDCTDKYFLTLLHEVFPTIRREYGTYQIHHHITRWRDLTTSEYWSVYVISDGYNCIGNVNKMNPAPGYAATRILDTWGSVDSGQVSYNHSTVENAWTWIIDDIECVLEQRFAAFSEELAG